MKKTVFLITLITVFLSCNLFAREPVFIISKKNGQKVHLEDGSFYVGYKHVVIEEVPRLWPFQSKVKVNCYGSGHEPCRAVIGGAIYSFAISDINNPESTSDFCADIINNITTELLDLVDKNNIEKNSSGNLSKNYLLADEHGVIHYVSFITEYELNEDGDGKISIYINTFKP